MKLLNDKIWGNIFTYSYNSVNDAVNNSVVNEVLNSIRGFVLNSIGISICDSIYFSLEKSSFELTRIKLIYDQLMDNK